MDDLPIPRTDVEAALGAVLEDAAFQSAPLRARFLSYVVTETLEGRTARLKGTAIAIDVYGRSADFDPQTDPIVRVDARRIRRDLEHYYLTGGRGDAVVIDLPKGGYVPTFRRRAPASAGAGGAGHALRSPSVPDGAVVAAKNVEETRPTAVPGKSLTLVALSLLGITVLMGVLWWSTRALQNPAAVSAGPTLYVLPFQATARDPDEVALAQGITIEIVDRLSPFKGIEVHPVGAGFPVERMLDQVGDGVAFTLEGFVQIVEDDVRITAKLQRTADGLHVWSERFSETFTPAQLFDIQDQIAHNVIGELAESHGLLAELSLREFSASARPSLRAYECVLLGYRYRASFARDLHGAARDCLEEVVEEKPDYARAWSLLAHVYVDEHRFFYNTRPNAQGRAVEAGQRAIALAPEDSLSHQAASIALYNAGRTEEALAAARKAIELNPHNYVALMQLGYRMFAARRWDEAASIVDEAIAKTLSPPVWYPWVRAILHIREGDFEAARTMLDPINAPQLALVSATQAAVYGQLGMTENAAFALDRTRQLDPEFDTRARDWFANQQFPDELLEAIMAGLVKAGL